MSSVSRRDWIRMGSACLVAGIPIRALAADQPSPDPLLSMNRASFLPLLGSSFTVTTEEGKTAWLTLIAANDMSLARGGAAVPVVDTFELRFYGAGEPLGQGSYEFAHAEFAKISLFIVPAGQSTYSAIISHLKSPLPPGHRIPKRQPAAAAAVVA